MSVLEKIAVDELHPAGDNPRTTVAVDDEMVATVKQLGILEPLIVNKSSVNGYTIVAGHRRLEAAKRAGLKFVPCVIHDDLSDRERAEMMLVENLQRDDLTALEEAAAYERLIKLGHSQRQLAKIVGRSQPHISKRTALLKLPDVARAALDAGGITLEDAAELTKLPAGKAAELWKKGKPQGWAIADAVRKHEHEQKRVALRKELEKAGVPLVEMTTVVRWEHELDRIGVDEQAHSTEPCHAAVLDQFSPRFDLVCTDPARHAPDGESELKAAEEEEDDDTEYVPPAETGEQKKARLERERERKAQEAQRAERQKLIDARRAFAATIVDKGAVGDVVEMMAMALAADGYIEAPLEDEIALAMVGLEVDRRSWDGRKARTRAWLQEAEKNRARLVLATAFACLEHMLEQIYEDEDRVHARTYLEWLIARGYQSSDVDTEFLGAPSVEGHEISIAGVGRAKPPKKWRVTCSCGDLDTTQTTEAYAKERADAHLSDVGWEGR